LSVIRILDRMNGSVINALNGRNSIVDAVCFSSNNSNVISGSRGKTIRIWDDHIEDYSDYNTLNWGLELSSRVSFMRMSVVWRFSRCNTDVNGSLDANLKLHDQLSGEFLNNFRHSENVFCVISGIHIKYLNLG